MGSTETETVLQSSTVSKKKMYCNTGIEYQFSPVTLRLRHTLKERVKKLLHTTYKFFLLKILRCLFYASLEA